MNCLTSWFWTHLKNSILSSQYYNLIDVKDLEYFEINKEFEEWILTLIHRLGFLTFLDD